MNSYRDLVTWQKAMTLVETIYRSTDGFPSRERFGLVAQIRRASVSIPSNIAEGHGRPRADYKRFLRMARGSLNELHTQVEIAKRLGFLTDTTEHEISLQILNTTRLLNALIRSLITTTKP